MATTKNSRDLAFQNNIETKIRTSKTIISTAAPWTNLYSNPADPTVTQITKSTTTVENPDGTKTARLFVPTTTNTIHYLDSINYTTTSGVAYSSGLIYQQAIYMKAGSGGLRLSIVLRARKTTDVNVIRNLRYILQPSTAQVLSSTIDSGWSNYSINTVNVGNGWWKVVQKGTFTTTASAENYIESYIEILNSSGASSYSGNGTDGVYIYGPQGYVNSQPDEVLGDIWVNTSANSSSAYWNGHTWTYTAQSGISGLLTNEAHVIPATNDGVVIASNYTVAGGTFKLYSGSTDITTGNGVVYSGGTTKNGLILAINSTTGVYTLSSSAGWTTDVETFTLTATYLGAAVTKTYTISKAKTGVSPGFPYTFSTNTSATDPGTGVFKFDSGTAASVTKLYISELDYNSTDRSGVFAILDDNTGTQRALIMLPGITAGFGFSLYITGDITDNGSWVTIPVTVASGNLPSNGETRYFYGIKSGSSGLSAILSNEAHVFPASTTGAVSSYAGSGTQIKVYEGTEELVYDGVGTTAGTWTIAAIDLSNIQAGTITDSGTYATVGQHSSVANGTDTSSITYNITGKNKSGTTFTIAKTQTFSKSKTGATGTRGTITTSRSIGGTSWSDAEADTAISNAGGGSPIQGDVVTLYNNSQSFSQTRIRSSGATWTVLTAFFGGDVVVDNTLSASKIVAGSITANQLKVFPKGLNPDPMFEGVWVGAVEQYSASNAAVPSGCLGRLATKFILRDNPGPFYLDVIPGEVYKISIRVNRQGLNSGVSAGWVGYSFDAAGNDLYSYPIGYTTSTGWQHVITDYTVPNNVARVRLMPWIDKAGNDTTQYAWFSDFQVEKKNDSSLIVDGAVTANKINVNDSIVIASGGNIRSGRAAYDSTTTGFWLGTDNNTGKFSVGTGSGNQLVFDGIDLKVEYSNTNLVVTGYTQNNYVLDYAYNPTTTNVTVTATITFNTNGTVTADSGDNWYKPTTTGIGTGKYIKFTRTSGSTPSGQTFTDGATGWIELSSSRSISVSVSGSGSFGSSSYGIYQISTSSSGSPVVATGDYELIAEKGILP